MASFDRLGAVSRILGVGCVLAPPCLTVFYARNGDSYFILQTSLKYFLLRTDSAGLHFPTPSGGPDRSVFAGTSECHVDVCNAADVRKVLAARDVLMGDVGKPRNFNA